MKYVITLLTLRELQSDRIQNRGYLKVVNQIIKEQLLQYTFTDGEPYGQFNTFPSLRLPQMSYIAQYSSECLHMDKTIAKKKKVRQRKTLLILSTTVSTEEKRKKENQARIFNVFDSSVI